MPDLVTLLVIQTTLGGIFHSEMTVFAGEEWCVGKRAGRKRGQRG